MNGSRFLQEVPLHGRSRGLSLLHEAQYHVARLSLVAGSRPRSSALCTRLGWAMSLCLLSSTLLWHPEMGHRYRCVRGLFGVIGTCVDLVGVCVPVPRVLPAVSWMNGGGAYMSGGGWWCGVLHMFGQAGICRKALGKGDGSV